MTTTDPLMDYQLKTHCPNCFQLSNVKVCTSCSFDREAYLYHHAAAHHLPLFTVLEKGYVIGRVLGEGCFAIVYAAIREKDRLACAVKEYYPRDLAQRSLDNKTVQPKRDQEQLTIWQSRFIQEAELLRSCYDHPSVESGIVRYTGIIKQHNTAYLVMERVSGITLNEHLSKQKQLSADKICLWLKPLLETLQKLHAKEIYHRDISTHNIFLSAPDNPVLMDFGLAREGLRDELLKSSSLSAGSFIAPEQLTGGYCDQRTDLYALGAVLYLCLHGEMPPPVEARRQGAALKTLTSADKTAQALQTVAVHCLQLNLNLRPKNAAHLIAQLSPFWMAQTPQSRVSLETNVPIHAHSRLNSNPNPVLNPLPAQPHSFFHSLLIFLCTLGALVGLVYGGFIAYQNYDLKESEQRKQDNLLFSQAQSIADYKAYLNTCITCENQQRAMERIAQLEQEQQALLSQQKQQEQDALLFNKAQTLDELKTYLGSCVLCTDKPKAEEKLAQLNQALQSADQAQLAEQEKEIAIALKTKGSSIDFYQQNCPTNIQFWQRTAEQGYAVAQLLLGGCYRSGDGVKQDYVETLKWYRKAAEQGNPYAQNNLAMMYQNGYGTVKNDNEAAKWYRKAAEQGQPNAQYLLGVMYENGQGITQDYKQAVDWYLRAAEQENADAQYSLGSLYHYGSGVTQDYQAALLWYRKSAEQGNAKAQYLLGIMYQNGYGVDPDDQAALDWYQKAADQGNADAIAQMKTLEVSKTPETFSAEVIKP
jgi:TPR repeat protein